MSDAYTGRFLVADLGACKSRVVRVPGWMKQTWAGGKGFGAKLLHDLLPKGTNALSPDNLLMFMTGPLTGTSAPSMRACVVCKSPLTHGYLDSYFGGHLGPEIRFAGYDGIILLGRASSPVYLWIHDDKVVFRDAGPAWGKDALEANAWIKADIGVPSAKAATIGPAGENQVGYALISCEYNRQAGRGGAGAVMGSKNLKGLAVKGSHRVRVADPKGFNAAVSRAVKEIGASEECRALTETGTSYAVPWSSATGTLPVKNFRSQHDPKADAIGDIGQKKHLFLTRAACFACPIRCAQMGAVRTGRYASFITDTIEYESAAMLGSNLGIHDIRAVAHLARCCDRLGVDTISMGNVIGFAFEAAEKGLIQGPAAIPLDWGSVSGAEYIIKTVCKATDELGRLLGLGVKQAAAQLGGGADAFALHVKGLEIPGWAPRGTPGMGLAYMTADRGACHQRGFMIAYETGGALYQGRPVSAYGLDQKAEILKGEQDYLAGTDTLVKCDFAAFGISPATFAALFSTATGQTISSDFLTQTGERIWNLVRCFNLREGLDPKQDRLPSRITRSALDSGPHQGQRISPEAEAQLRSDYYQVRGWGADGRPGTRILDRLGLSHGPSLEPQAFLTGRQTPGAAAGDQNSQSARRSI